MVISQNFKYGDITAKAIRSGMNVYDYFKNGYSEIVYKKALKIEFREASLEFKSEVNTPIFYKGELIHSRRFDLLIADKVLIEIKAVKEIDNGDINQVLNYLKVFNIEVALLFNFGADKFYFRRFVL
jgi:GxxExxY protein